MHAPNGNPEVVWRGISFVRARREKGGALWAPCVVFTPERAVLPRIGTPARQTGLFFVLCHASRSWRANRSRIRLLARQQAS